MAPPPISNTIRRLRFDHNEMTQQELADRIGMTRQTVAAIEQNEKIDVTPCTDATGKWAPSAECKNFPSEPAQGTGTFPACSIPLTTGPIESCGASATSVVAPTTSTDAGQSTL